MDKLKDFTCLSYSNLLRYATRMLKMRNGNVNTLLLTYKYVLLTSSPCLVYHQNQLDYSICFLGRMFIMQKKNLFVPMRVPGAYPHHALWHRERIFFLEMKPSSQ